jgi:hypothetical protein
MKLMPRLRGFSPIRRLGTRGRQEPDDAELIDFHSVFFTKFVTTLLPSWTCVAIRKDGKT